MRDRQPSPGNFAHMALASTDYRSDLFQEALSACAQPQETQRLSASVVGKRETGSGRLGAPFRFDGGKTLLFNYGYGRQNLLRVFDVEAGSAEDWDIDFQPFSFADDPHRNLLWMIDPSGFLARGFSLSGREVLTVPIPERTPEGEALVPRHLAAGKNTLCISYVAETDGIMAIAIDPTEGEPVFLRRRLPATDRIYCMDDLLVTLHTSPNSVMIHSLRQEGITPLRSFPVRGEPHTLAWVRGGFVVCAAEEVVRFESGSGRQERIRLSDLPGVPAMEWPMTAQAANDEFWLKDWGSGTMYRIRIHQSDTAHE